MGTYLNKSTGQPETNHINSELPKKLGEQYSENTFCMMYSLIPNDDASIFANNFHPICFPSYCSSLSLIILIYDQYIVCQRKGGNVEAKGYTGILHFPDYNLIYAETIVCNDLFDCIENNLKVKVSVETGQFVILPEFGDDGVSSKYGVQYMKNKKFTVCLKEFNKMNNLLFVIIQQI